MFTPLAFVISGIAVALAQQPVVTCIRAGLNQAASCTQFVDTFCNDVSLTQTPIRVGDTTSRCFVTPVGHSCAFNAFNSHTSEHAPNNMNCKNGLRAVISQCPYGGQWAYPNNGSFTFDVDSNVARCGTGITL